VQSSEYPYYAVKGIIVYDALPVAGIVFSLISLWLLIFNQRLQTSTIWQRNEWCILCCLIIVYIYTLVHMIGATLQCYAEAHRCPWQLYATVGFY
jgi:cell shape-determining protein MreD